MLKHYHIPKENKTVKPIDYLLFFLLIQIGWLPIIFNIHRLVVLVNLVFAFYISYRRNKGVIFDINIFLLFIIYVALALAQGVIWGLSIISLITSFTISFLIPYYLFKSYYEDFFFILEKVIRILTIIALTIWFTHQFIPGAKEIIISIINIVNKYNDEHLVRGMIFYTYWGNVGTAFGVSRNAGFASEPGAFAVFLMLGIIINYINDIPLFHKRNLLYIVATITTFSTAGYLALASLGFLLLKHKKGRIFGLLLFPLFLYGAVFAYKNMDFMQNKIEEQFEEQTKVDLYEPTSGRFLGARKSLYVLSQYPLHGRGLLAMTKAEKYSDPESAGYGWLSEMARFGILLGALYMYFFFKGLYFLIKSGGKDFYEFVVFSLAIMINLSAQVYITSSFFIIFFYLGLYKSKKINYKYPYAKTN